MNKLLLSALVGILWVCHAPSVKAGTAGYFAKCSFIDRGGDNGGSITDMPCYAVEGATVQRAFFFIVWRDGVKTMLDTEPHRSFQDMESKRTYKRQSNFKFIADSDGDTILLKNVKHVSNEYDFRDPKLHKKIWKSR
jgi:hypothetical protein